MMNQLQEALDAHLRASYSDTNPGAAVLVYAAGEVLYEQGIGIADLSKGEHITPATTFRLASVSKQFTAIAIQLLEQQRLLRYEDSLQHFFPGFATGIGDRIKIRHLLTHTSGLLDYEGFVEERAGYQISDEEVLEIAVAQNATYFAPGTAYRYSNTGFVLLALVVEKVSGIPYADFLQQRMFEPLGMHHTTLYEPGKTIPNRAMGCSRNAAGEFVFSDQGTCTATKGDGCIYTSVQNYLKWHQALGSSPGMAPAFGQVHAPIPGYKGGCYSMGWFFAKRRSGGLEMYHTGNTSGFSNLVIRIPEEDVLIAYFSNMADNPYLLTDFLDVLELFPLLRPESGLVRDMLELAR